MTTRVDLIDKKFKKNTLVEEVSWKALPQKVIALYSKPLYLLGLIRSSTGHAKPRVNTAGPSAKAKYTKTPIVN